MFGLMFIAQFHRSNKTKRRINLVFHRDLDECTA